MMYSEDIPLGVRYLIQKNVFTVYFVVLVSLVLINIFFIVFYKCMVNPNGQFFDQMQTPITVVKY